MEKQSTSLTTLYKTVNGEQISKDFDTEHLSVMKSLDGSYDGWLPSEKVVVASAKVVTTNTDDTKGKKTKEVKPKEVKASAKVAETPIVPLATETGKQSTAEVTEQ